MARNELRVPLSSMLAFHWAHGFRSHFNICRLYDCPSNFDVDAFERAIWHIVCQNEAFRMVFHIEGHQLFQALRPMESIPFGVERYDERGVPDAMSAARVEAIAQEVQASLRLDDERCLLRVGHIDFGPERPGRVIIAVHHFIIDGYSFDLFLDALTDAFAAIREGREPAAASKSSSLSAWLHTHHAYANTGAEEQLEHWASVPWDRFVPTFRGTRSGRPTRSVPRTVVYDAYRTIHYRHHGGPGIDDEQYRRACALTGRCYVSLSEAQTEAFFAHRAAPEDRYVLGLFLALRPLIAKEGLFLSFTVVNRMPFVVRHRALDVMGHIFEQMPLLVDLEGAGTTEGRLARISALRKDVRRGLSYGPLKFINERPSTQERVSALPYPEVCLNVWANNFSSPCGGALVPSREFAGVENALSLSRELYHAALWVQVIKEPSRLVIELRYPPDELAYDDIEALGRRYLDALVTMLDQPPP